MIRATLLSPLKLGVRPLNLPLDKSLSFHEPQFTLCDM